MVGQNLGQSRPQHGVGRVVGGRDADRAGRLVAQFAQRGQLVVDLLEARRHRLQQSFAGLRGGHAARGAAQQAQAQARLQRAHRVAERGRRHPQLRGRAREAALLCDGHERDQVVDVLALHS